MMIGSLSALTPYPRDRPSDPCGTTYIAIDSNYRFDVLLAP